MKKITLIYWFFIGLMCAFILFGAMSDILENPLTLSRIKGNADYIGYLVQFSWIMKVFGIIIVLCPKFPRLKEWAYAGLTFNALGTAYAHLVNEDQLNRFTLPVITLMLVLISYYLYTIHAAKFIKPMFYA